MIKVLQSGDDVFDLGGQLGLGLDLTLVTLPRNANVLNTELRISLT